MIYLQLFVSFFCVGLLSFGGGYAAMPLIQSQVITAHNWMTMSEFTDLVAISQMTPGPIITNAATFVGFRMAGLPGALIATAGSVLPSCIIVGILTMVYLKYRRLAAFQDALKRLRPAVVALIASAGVTILVSAFTDAAYPLMMGVNVCLCLVLLMKLRWHPVLVMTLAGVFNVLCHMIIS